MDMTHPMADCRDSRLHLLNAQRFRHLLLLLYWPAFGLAFYLAERVFIPDRYYVMHCALDDLIPFWEVFVIPYVFWFVYLLGIHIYTGLFDVAAFKRMMTFIILTYSAALVFFLLFPTAQHLRPEVFPRDNALTRFMDLFYRMDTNTNVCPSLHVVGSLAVTFAAWDTPKLQSRRWKAAFGTVTVLICASTVFLKQHSVIDVAAGLLFSAAAYQLVYRGGLARVSAAFARRREVRRRRFAG